MMFEFIKTELTEARYMRTERDIAGRTNLDIGETLFQHVLSLEQLRHENPKVAAEYAKRTLLYQNFNKMRPGGTDMYNMASILNNPSDYSDLVSDAEAVRFDELRFKRYLRGIIAGRKDAPADRQFFLRLQKDLRISNPILKQIRRIAGDYAIASPAEKQAITSRMLLSFRPDRKFKSDLFKLYAPSVKDLSPADAGSAAQSGKQRIIPRWAKYAGLFAAGYQIGKHL